MSPKLLDTDDPTELSHAPDAVSGGLKCVFSDKRHVKIGTGTTSRKHSQNVYWYVEQIGPEKFAIWMLNDNGVPTGNREVVDKDELLGSYYPELKYYTKHVEPKVLEMTAAVKRGDAKRKVSDFENAEDEYNEALKFDEENVRAVFGLGLTHLGRGDVDKAQHTFKDLLALEGAFEPEHKHLFNEMGIQLRKNRMLTEAVAFYRRAMDLSEDDEHLHYNLARAYYEGNNWEGCLDSLEKCLGYVPPLKEAVDLLELIREMVGNSGLREQHGKPQFSRPQAERTKELWSRYGPA